MDTAVDVGGAAIGVAVDVGEGALEIGAEVVERTADFFIGLIDEYAPGLLEFLRGGFMGRLTDLFCRGLDAVVGGIVSSLENIDFVSALEETFASAQGSVEGVIGAIRGGASSALGALMQPVVEALDQYGPGIIEAITGASDSVNGFFDGLWESIGAPAMDFLEEAGGAVWQEISDTIDWLWEATSDVRDAASDAWDWVMSQFEIAWDSTAGIREWLEAKAIEAWDSMKEALGPLEGPLTTLAGVLLILSPLGPIVIATQVIPPLWEKLTWLWNNWNTNDILVWAQDILRDDILPGIIGLVSGVASSIATAAAWISSATVGVAEAFGVVVSAFGTNTCLATVTRVLTAVSSQFERLAAWAEGGFTGLADAVANVFSSLVAILQPILDFLIRLLIVALNPPMLPIAIVGLIWMLIPDELKPPVINFVLDLIIAFLRGFPAFLTGLGALASILKAGFLGFLEAVRGHDDQRKIDASNKVANLMAGGGVQFIAGVAVGILEGLLDGILDPFRLIWMLIQFLARLCRSLGDYLAPLVFETSPSLGAAVGGVNGMVRASIPAHPPAHAPPPTTASGPASHAASPAPPAGAIVSPATAAGTAPDRTTAGSAVGPTSSAPPTGGSTASSSATATPEDVAMAEIMAAGPTASDADIVAALPPGIAGELAGSAGELDAASTEGEASAESEVSSEGGSVGGLSNLLGGIWTAIIDGAHGLGASAANALIEFIMLPDYQLGNKLGYVAGLILLEVLIAYFSGGVSLELKAAEPFIKAAIRFLDLGGEILGLLGRAVRPLKGPLLRGLSAAGEHLGRFRFLQPILARIRRAADTLFHFGDEAAEAAGRASGRADDAARHADDIPGAGRHADDAGRQADDAAAAARKAAELPIAIAAAEAICAANDRLEPSPPPLAVHAQLNTSLRPRFRWINGFFSVPKGPGIYEIHMQASDHVVDRRYTTVRTDVLDDAAESADPRTHGIPDRPPPESPHIIGADEARIRVVHDLGVDGGRLAAIGDGLHPNMPGTSRTWANPYEFDGPFGHGIDDIMFDGNGVPIILEFKGGRSALGPGQLSPRWVRTKIAELRRVRDPMADALETAFNNGTLTSRIYRTPVDDVGNALGTFLEETRHYPPPVAGLPPVQPKLVVTQSGDPYEHEADRVADAVASSTSWSSAPEISAYHEQAAMPAPLPGTAPGSTSQSFENTLNASEASGSALNPATRGHMETRFGVDFGHVRVHTGGDSAALNRQVDSHAFTTGRHIYFAPGQYQPGTHRGDRLLAHELTHVVQQSGGVATTRPLQRFETKTYYAFGLLSGRNTHELAENALRSVNSDLVTEAPIPGATTDTMFGPGTNQSYFDKVGRADLYISADKGTAIGVKGVFGGKDGESRHLEHPDFKYAGFSSGATKVGTGAASKSPKFNKVTGVTGQFPATFAVADLKPLSLAKTTEGIVQIANYREGLPNFVRQAISDKKVTSPTKKGTVLSTLNIPAGHDFRRFKTEHKLAGESSLVFAASNQRLWLYPTKKGIYYYLWLPNSFTTPGAVSNYTHTKAELTRMVTELKRPPAKTKRTLAPARRLRSVSAAPTGPPRPAFASRQIAPPGSRHILQRKDAPLAAHPPGTDWGAAGIQWENEREDWSLKYAKPLIEQTKGFEEIIDAKESLGLSSADAESALGADLAGEAKEHERIELWAGLRGKSLGAIRFKLGPVFDRVAGWFERIGKKFKGIQSKVEGVPGSFGIGWRKTLVTVLVKGVKLAFKEFLHATFSLFADCFNGVIEAVTSEFIEEANDELHARLEGLEAKFTEFKEKLETEYEATFDLLEGLVADISDAKKWLDLALTLEGLIRTGVQVVACLTPPALGCLWGLVVQIGIEAALDLIIDTDWFQNNIGRPQIKKIVDRYAGPTYRKIMQEALEKVGLGSYAEKVEACHPSEESLDDHFFTGLPSGLRSGSPALLEKRSKWEAMHRSEILRELQKRFTGKDGKPVTEDELLDLAERLGKEEPDCEDKKETIEEALQEGGKADATAIAQPPEDIYADETEAPASEDAPPSAEAPPEGDTKEGTPPTPTQEDEETEPAGEEAGGESSDEESIDVTATPTTPSVPVVDARSSNYEGTGGASLPNSLVKPLNPNWSHTAGTKTTIRIAAFLNDEHVVTIKNVPVVVQKRTYYPDPENSATATEVRIYYQLQAGVSFKPHVSGVLPKGEVLVGKLAWGKTVTK